MGIPFGRPEKLIIRAGLTRLTTPNLHLLELIPTLTKEQQVVVENFVLAHADLVRRLAQ